MDARRRSSRSSRFHSNFLTSFVAGGLSGATVKTCVAPLERVKLLLQTQDANPRVISGQVPRYTGIADCFRRVSTEQGIGAFWRGNGTNLLRFVPAQAFTFAFKDSIKEFLPKVDKQTEFRTFFTINVIAGGLAGACSLLIVYPLDVARTRFTSDIKSNGEHKFRGIKDYMSQTVRKGGIHSLFKGVGISLIGILPYRGIYLGMFDTLSSLNPNQHSKDTFQRAGSKFLCAQVSAVSAAYVSYPFDTVRRRLQLQKEQQHVYKGALDCIATIVKEEGPRSLYKGAGANALRTVGAALVLVLHSELLLAFR